MPRSAPDGQTGATLLEILVTIMIVSFGLLGIAGQLLAAAKYQQTAQYRNTAYTQMQAMAERIRSNSTVLTNGASDATSYLADDGYANAATLPSNPNCGGNGQTACTPAQAAQRDVREWRQTLARELPSGRGSLYTVTSGANTALNQRRLYVMWSEKPQNSDDNLGALPTDSNCPTPRVAGIRCLSMVVYP